MHFIHPIYFLLSCVLIIAIPVIATIAGVRRKKALKTLLGSSAQDSEAVKCSYVARRFRIFFLLMAMVFLSIAATRPFWSSKMVPFEAKGRDLLILFDVSKSMLSSDLTPSRLEHAKYILREIVKADPQDSFGLVAFAGNAYLTCPLTSDPVAFEQYVNELNPSLVPIGGTNLELALNTAVRAFKVASSNNRAIILLTDGDELTGNSSKIINELKRRNIPLLVIGLGDPNTGAPVKDENGNYRRDANGKIITTKLNETSLQKLAIQTGGIYVRSTITDTGVSQITSRIDKLGTAQTANKGKKTLPVERFPLFLIASAVMLFFYYLISESPAKKVKSPLVGLFLLASFLLPLGVKANTQNQTNLIPQNTPTPLQINNNNNTPTNQPKTPQDVLQPKVQENLPQDAQQLYNLALEKQKNNDPNAEKLYEEVLKKSENFPSLRVKTLQNLGVNIHNKARSIVGKSLQELKAQQLDKTLTTLTSAQELLKGAEELYSKALSVANTPSENLSTTAANLQQLALDKNKIEELKKKIEELKKQQQKAQEQAQKAKDEQQKQNNKQQQNKQQQKQNKDNKQQKQDKQNQQQQQNNSANNKNEQKNKDNQQQKSSNQINKASNEAQKLQEQAKQLKQDNLAKAAQKAKEELDKAAAANKENKKKEAEKHIDEAIKALNSQKDKQNKQNNNNNQDNKNQNKDNKNKQQQQQQQQKNQPPKQQQQNAQPDNPKANKDDLKNAQELLKLLNDEENQRRKDLHRVPQNRRIQVEKDW